MVLGAELLCAVFLVAGPRSAPSEPAVAAPVAPQPAVGTSVTRVESASDGRTAELIDLGAPGGGTLLDRISTELPGAAAAVTAFWGPQWRRDIHVVVAGSPDQFAVLAGGGADVAATTTPQRITFSPAAVAMSDADLRIVLRHELFHYAARSETAADAPVWLTEGVADFVGRPKASPPPAAPTSLPVDAELAEAGPGRSDAYDRAWEFASYLAEVYGPDRLRAFYIAACGHGHPDVATAFRDVFGVDLSAVLAGAQ